MSNRDKSMDVGRMYAVANDVKELLVAIGNPYRLMILCLLMDGERNVTEICDALEARQSLVSQHMTLLRHMDIVACERRGHFNYYSIKDETTKDIVTILHQHFCATETESHAA